LSAFALDDSGQLFLLDLSGEQVVMQVFDTKGQYLESAVLSDDGKRVACCPRSAAADGVRMWHADNWKQVTHFRFPPGGQVVLEQPDKFRPPSHASKLNARSTLGPSGSGASFNQGMNEKEKAKSKQRKYPNMFPSPGTWMYWFLTTKVVHYFTTLVCLNNPSTVASIAIAKDCFTAAEVCVIVCSGRY